MTTTNDTPTPEPVYPKVRLDFYEAAILLTRFEDGRVTTYPVSIHDVAQACAGVEMFTGLLPANTLFWKRQGDTTTLAIAVPAQRWQVQWADGAGYHLPLPPFIFAGSGTFYYAYAVKQRPRHRFTRLWHMPCPNVHPNGRICPGDTPFPACSAETIEPALRLFLEGSRFNGDLVLGKCQAYPNDVRRLWQELDGRNRFPLPQLVPLNATLQNLLG
ncbi:MAG: prokaryotic E2 ligase family D protein [Chloroflexi bacterium]|nr:prokaryotic E2 ligase family D protein [Chloroflexota bacterium]MCI0648720.1 prokaryotic E2 ligase family D protein [Chloroflexota bacterium]MCI0727725.1 prokaryotic E2 ligase family D protein [Chloroflexota bacterium]